MLRIVCMISTPAYDRHFLILKLLSSLHLGFADVWPSLEDVQKQHLISGEGGHSVFAYRKHSFGM